LLEVTLNVELLGSWEHAISAKHDATITIHNVTPYGRSYAAQGLFVLDSANGYQILMGLRNHPDVIKVDVITEDENRITGSIVARPWMTCSVILRSDCFFEEAVITPQGTEWSILTQNEVALSGVVNNLREIGCTVRLLSKHETESGTVLTRRQEFVLRRALELGYYDYPSRINAKELAAVLKIAPATLCEILRRSEHKLINFYIRKVT